MALDESEELMRKSRFSEDQVVKILREADRLPVAEIAEKYGSASKPFSCGASVWHEDPRRGVRFSGLS